MLRFCGLGGAGLIITIAIAVLAVLLLMRPVSAASGVVINELLWMGSSSSSADEWLELRNLTDQPVDLSNWVLTKKSSGADAVMLTIPTGSTVPAHGFFLIANYAESHASSRLAATPNLVEADVSLVNSALQIKLYDAAGALVDAADDGSGAPLAGQYESGAVWKSMERNAVPGDGSLKTSWHTASASIGFDVGAPEFGTPGATNSNQPPIIAWSAPDEVSLNESSSFDASESADQDGDPLTFSWNFGDGSTANGPTPTHQFLSSGSFTVALIVSDGQSESHVQQTVRVIAEAQPAFVPSSSTQAPTPPAPTTTAPAPSSKTTPQPMFKDATGNMLISMVLPNPSGSDAEGELIELVNADDHAIDLRGWSVTDTTTKYPFRESTPLAPGERLVLDRATTRIALNNTGESIFLLRPDGSRANGVKYASASEGARFIRQGTSVHWRWEDTKESGEDGDDRDVWEGVVTSLPGTFSRQWFTLRSDRGAIQVYASTGRFPELTLGSGVRVAGTFAQLKAGPRLRIAAPDDIVALETGDAEPDHVAVSDLAEADVFRFVTLTGAISRGNGRQLLLDDGTGEIPIALPTGMPKPKLDGEVSGKASGIMTIAASGVILRLRGPDDLALDAQVLGASSVEAPPTTYLRQPTPSSTSVPLAPASKPPLLAYGLIGLAGLAGLGFLLWRRRRTSYLLEDDSPDP